MRRPSFGNCGKRGPDSDAPEGSTIWARCSSCKQVHAFIVREVAAVVG